MSSAVENLTGGRDILEKLEAILKMTEQGWVNDGKLPLFSTVIAQISAEGVSLVDLHKNLGLVSTSDRKPVEKDVETKKLITADHLFPPYYIEKSRVIEKTEEIRAQRKESIGSI